MNGVRFHAVFLSGTVKRCRCPFHQKFAGKPAKKVRLSVYFSDNFVYNLQSVIFDSGGETFVNSDFPRILTLLRKEQGISQKKAAADLGISQALLSHYEKGIRECGLDFIVRTADYYGVSCDYLLGKTPHRQGEKLHVPETEEEDTHDGLPNVSRKIISNSLHIVFGILKKINSKSLTKEITLYLSGAVYNAFRMLYTAKSSIRCCWSLYSKSAPYILKYTNPNQRLRFCESLLIGIFYF